MIKYRQFGYMIGVRDCEGFAMDLSEAILECSPQKEGSLFVTVIVIYMCAAYIWCGLFCLDLGPRLLRSLIGVSSSFVRGKHLTKVFD